MTFKVLFHPEAAQGIAAIPAPMKQRLQKAVQERLMVEPTLYGKPLRATLKGYWKLRVGDYRVVYSIQGSEVLIYAICHRRHVYSAASGRLTSQTIPRAKDPK